MSDIIERLTRHAEVSDNALGVETALGRLLREAADIITMLRDDHALLTVRLMNLDPYAAKWDDAAKTIERLRAEINASWGVAGTRVTGSDDVT